MAASSGTDGSADALYAVGLATPRLPMRAGRPPRRDRELQRDPQSSTNLAKNPSPWDGSAREPTGFPALACHLDEQGPSTSTRPGEPLRPPGSATTLRVKAGTSLVHDGPYADTKEQLGGFMILELPSLDAALGWAARCPGTNRPGRRSTRYNRGHHEPGAPLRER